MVAVGLDAAGDADHDQDHPDGAERIGPGRSALVQLVLHEQVGAWRGDPVVLRDASDRLDALGIDRAVAIAFGCIILLLLGGALYSREFLSPNYLLQQLQIAAFLGVIAIFALMIWKPNFCSIGRFLQSPCCEAGELLA